MLEVLLMQYREIFGEDFPLLQFEGKQEIEVINILYDCVSKCLPYHDKRRTGGYVLAHKGYHNGRRSCRVYG